MAKAIMIQGTTSNAGKSIVTAGLCRIFYKDGYKTAPFKSQNMALNSFVTKDGCEMGRAQVMQAEACNIEPDVRMNPILLKPTSDSGSQVILNGKAIRNMSAKEYFKFKTTLIEDIKEAYNSLSNENDIIVLEGAGSPAEINLKQNDIVNMGMAEMADCPVLIVADIDRGGVFASLYGTVMLLDENERKRVKGLLINKFRGDLEILKPGLKQIEELTEIPVIGVIPYEKFDIDDEDSLSERIIYKKRKDCKIKIGVIKLPKISNYTDFNCFERINGVGIFYTDNADEISDFDMIIIPGSKNTISDLLWLRQNGIESEIKKAASKDKIIFGICGGYQMMGQKIFDSDSVEGDIKEINGIGLLNIKTIFTNKKNTIQVKGNFLVINGVLNSLSNLKIDGYEIHMGESYLFDNALPMSVIEYLNGETKLEGCQNNNCYGTYIHGIFDSNKISTEIIKTLFKLKNINADELEEYDINQYKEEQYDILENTIRNSIDMETVYKILNKEI